MNPFRRKAVENAIIAILRDHDNGGFTLKDLRPLVAELLDGCTPPELGAAVQSLRYTGKLAWDRLELSQSMRTSAGTLSAAEQEGGAASNSAPPSDTECAAPVALEGPELGAARMPGSGPDDDDPTPRPGSGDEDPGDVNDEAREGPQAEQGPEGREPLPPKGAPGDGPVPLREEQRAVPGGRLEKPRSDAKVDQPSGARPQLTKAEKHIRSTTRSWQAKRASRPMPAPQHETEVERAVREEASADISRRYAARSTGTVRQPLELKKFGVDLSLGESVVSLLAASPADLMVAIGRRHPALWRRVILLGRRADKRTAEALYWALERGLDELEAALPQAQGEEQNAA